MSWYMKALRNYANFNGRARRKEFWFFCLINFLIQVVLYIPIIIFMLNEDLMIIGWIFYGILMIYALAMMIPSISVSVRRLHDQDKSGWWYFIQLVPLIGGIWFLVLMFLDSTPGDNEYGPNPKGL